MTDDEKRVAAGYQALGGKATGEPVPTFPENTPEPPLAITTYIAKQQRTERT
ncbi:MAG: hypothetical protein JNL45_01095 [Hyphomicrobium sp.]|nr:hypothetical protein [Hyphomicrobium sp.]